MQTNSQMVKCFIGSTKLYNIMRSCNRLLVAKCLKILFKIGPLINYLLFFIYIVKSIKNWRNKKSFWDPEISDKYRYKYRCLSPTFSTEVMKTEQPIRVKIMRPVKRCSRIPKNLGCSPGAEHSDSSFRLFTWEMESTVAATNHGKPITEHTPSITPTTNRSRW